jgi:hypothetical protein
MAKIFISHSGKDQAFAEALASELRKSQHEPKGDIQPMVGVQDLHNALLHELAESDVVVFLFTPNAVGSENILAEVGAARALCNIMQRPHIIPVVFAGGVLPEPISRVFAEFAPPSSQPPDLAMRLHAVITRLPLPSRRGVPKIDEKVTMRWVWDNVPATYWFALVSLLVSIAIGALTIGVKAGQDPSIARLFGEKSTTIGGPSTR